MGFELPDGSVRSPDVAWVRRERLARLTADQKRRFLPLCPDFVIELCSPSDPLAAVQISGGQVLPGFVLRLTAIWEPPL